MKKVYVFSAIIAMLLLGVVVYNFGIKTSRIDPAFEQLLTMPGVKPNTQDSLQDLRCNSVEDVGYTVKRDRINIDYGTQSFYILKETINDDDIKQMLKIAKLTVTQAEDGTVTVKFKGKEVSQWAE